MIMSIDKKKRKKISGRCSTFLYQSKTIQRGNRKNVWSKECLVSVVLQSFTSISTELYIKCHVSFCAKYSEVELPN